jgi:dipeptidyl aminopeptidase/acylaminoacyl peptidase
VTAAGVINAIDTAPLTLLAAIKSAQWSPNHGEVVVVGTRGPRSSSPPEFSRFIVEKGNAVEVPLVEIETGTGVEEDTWNPLGPEVAWSTNGALAIRARSKGHDAASREEWWAEADDRRLACLTCQLPSVPDKIYPVADSSFIAFLQGRLWRLSRESEPVEITSTVRGKIEGIECCEGQASGTIFVKTAIGDMIYLACLDQAGGTVTYMPLPDSSATVEDYSPRSKIVVLSSHGRALWITKVRSGTLPMLLVSSRTTAEGSTPKSLVRVLGYRSRSGQDLKALLYLPPDFKENETYPCVAVVYPGSIISDDEKVGAKRYVPISGAGYLPGPGYLLLHGYAVLLPSIPMPDSPGRGEPMTDLSFAVLPAVDEAVKTGLVDPGRVGLIGHSFGGYATLSLVTQTVRFKAAVSMDGSSDLLSQYGTLSDGTLIYDPDDTFPMTWSESGQVNMGAPPWKDLQRYLRNSPIAAADKVETPLLIIHGDLDSAVPIQQSEEFFTALRRQNKRAKFICYWGEGHIFENPADIRDARQEVLNWFAEFLKPNAVSSFPRNPLR